MQEKEFTMEDAFQVWWFIGWRTGLTLIVINLALNILTRMVQIGAGVSEVMGAGGIIISVLIAVYYIKLAVNRNYKGFRLSSVVR